ncbi:MAG: DUF2169 domain-containing protein [Myxococcota bacterium]
MASLGSAIQGHRFGVVVAKATFDYSDGHPELVADEPYPVLQEDAPTRLGLLPRDDLVPEQGRFEVILLGKAYASRGLAPHVTVRLSVGDIQRELLVSGNRTWERQGNEFVPGRSETFDTLDLTWANAFGGTATVEIDEGSFLELPCSRNPDGKGYAPRDQLPGLRQLLQCEGDFPRLHTDPKVPNITRPEDAPTLGQELEPVCWATLPLSSGFFVDQFDVNTRKWEATNPRIRRCHPDWFIGPPERGAMVRMEGVGRHPVEFSLPELRVIADFAMSGASGRRELFPVSLVLLPEEARFYLVYKRLIRVSASAASAPVLRLRVSEGWRTEETPS